MIGIIPRNADKADVNTAHVNPSGTAVATGDDYGCVKLFEQFPVPEPYVSIEHYIHQTSMHPYIPLLAWDVGIIILCKVIMNACCTCVCVYMYMLTDQKNSLIN